MEIRQEETQFQSVIVESDPLSKSTSSSITTDVTATVQDAPDVSINQCPQSMSTSIATDVTPTGIQTPDDNRNPSSQSMSPSITTHATPTGLETPENSSQSMSSSVRNSFDTPEKTRSRKRKWRENKKAWRAKNKICPMMPRTPETRKKVLKRLCSQFKTPPRSTPKEENNIEERTRIFSALLNIKGHKDKGQFDQMTMATDNLLKDKKIVDLAKIMGIKSRPLYNLLEHRTPRRSTSTKKTTIEDKQEIREAFDDKALTMTVPHKRHSKHVFLKTTMSEAYSHYTKRQTSKSRRAWSKSTFNRYRPKNLKLVKHIPEQGCLCEDCLNCDLKRRKLSAKVKGISNRISVNLFKTMCNTTTKNPEDCVMTDFNLRCIQRKCAFCGVGKLSSVMLDEENKFVDWDEEVEWTQWERKTKTVIKGGVPKKRCALEISHKKTTLRQLFISFQESLKSMAVHQFNVRHQDSQFDQIRENLRPGDVLMICDFNMNYSHKQIEEPQSTFFSRRQTTCHNTVAYFPCPMPGCNLLAKDEIMCISDDLKHDAHAVQAFTDEMLSHLRSCGVDVKRVIRFSDNCAAQYKCSTVFDLISKMTIPIMCNFSEPRHGKGEADGLGGRVMQFLQMALASGKAKFTDAKSMADFLTKHFGELSCKVEGAGKNRRISQSDKERIAAFFEKVGSADRPNKSNCDGKVFLQRSLTDLYKSFDQLQKSIGARTVSFSSFVRHKPSQFVQAPSLAFVKPGKEGNPTRELDRMRDISETSRTSQLKVTDPRLIICGPDDPRAKLVAEKLRAAGAGDELNFTVDENWMIRTPGWEPHAASESDISNEIACAEDGNSVIQTNSENKRCPHNMRHFLCVNDIARPTDSDKIRTVHRTRQIHCFRNTGTAGFIEVRNNTCGCKVCLHGEEGECGNIDFVEKFARVNLHGSLIPVKSFIDNSLWSNASLDLHKKWSTAASRKVKVATNNRARNRTTTNPLGAKPCAPRNRKKRNLLGAKSTNKEKQRTRRRLDITLEHHPVEDNSVEMLDVQVEDNSSQTSKSDEQLTLPVDCIEPGVAPFPKASQVKENQQSDPEFLLPLPRCLSPSDRVMRRKCVPKDASSEGDTDATDRELEPLLDYLVFDSDEDPKDNAPDKQLIPFTQRCEIQFGGKLFSKLFSQFKLCWLFFQISVRLFETL